MSTLQRILFVLVLAVIAFAFFALARVPQNPIWSEGPPGIYAAQTDALAAGQLHLKLAPKPELLALPDPYDPAKNGYVRILDLSLYRGRYYSYFSSVPVLLLLLPIKLLTGYYFTQEATTALFLSLGVAIGAGLLARTWKSYWSGAPFAAVLVATMVLAFGSLVVVWLPYASIYQVPQACAFCMIMAAFALAERAMTAKSDGAPTWLFLTGLFVGLAIASRPNFLPAALALIPVAWTAAQGRSVSGRLARAFVSFGISAVPLAFVLAALLIHNYARFDNPLEFGMRYQLNDVDWRHQRMFSLTLFISHLRQLLWHPWHWSAYFPFVTDDDRQPIGVFSGIPFALFSLALVGSLGRRSSASERGLRTAVLLAGLGVLGLVASYFVFWARYEADAFGILMLAAGMGALRLGHHARVAEPGTKGSTRFWTAAWCSGLVVTGAVSVASAVCATYRLYDHPEVNLPRVARILNRPIYWLEDVRGVPRGPIRMKVWFPRVPPETRESLIVTGTNETDAVFLQYLSGNRVQFGYFRTGTGGPVTEPVEVDPDLPHTIEVAMGSLFPPNSYPGWERWTDGDRLIALRTLQLTLDGREVLRCDTAFHPSTPRDVRLLGKAPDTGCGARPFTGRVEAVERLPFRPLASRDWSSPQAGAISFIARFRPGERLCEPLVCTGEPGRGDLVYVEYLSENRWRIGHDHFGRGSATGPVFFAQPNREHTVVIQAAPLTGAFGAIGTTRLRVLLDGIEAFDAPREFFPSSGAEIAVGMNAILSSVTSASFGGRIRDVRSLASDQVGKVGGGISVSGTGRIEMDVAFPRSPRSPNEPLVVTGRTGAADVVYVRYEGDDRIRFAFDRWGSGGAIGASVPVSRDEFHHLAIELGSLTPATPDQPVRVYLDGRLVFEQLASCHVCRPDEIYVGRNSVGASTCAAEFSGRVFSARRAEP